MKLFRLFAILAMAQAAWCGQVTGKLVTPTSGPVAGATITFKPSQSAIVSGSYSVVPSSATCYTTTDGTIVGIPDPAVQPVVNTNTASGSLAAGTYYVVVSYYSSVYETYYSPETTVVLSASGSLIITAPTLQPTNATAYKVYIGTSSGTETLQSTQVGWTNYTRSTALSAGVALPSSNTSICTLVFGDTMIPANVTYYTNVVDAQGSQVPGYPQNYYLLGSTADFSSLIPASNLTARFPYAIVSNPSGNAQQSINSPLTLNGYTFTAGTLKAAILQSQTANPASAGVLRLAKSDCIDWRNNANNADVSLCLNASDQVATTAFAADNIHNNTTGTPLTIQGKQNTSGVAGDNVQIQGGSASVAGAGAAGTVTIQGGSSSISNGTGGAVTIQGGNGTSVLGTGNGGNVTIQPGAKAGVGSDGTVIVNGLVSKYNSIAVVSNGIPSEVATVDLTAQNAAITTTTLYAVPSTGAGQYRLTWDSKVTTVAGTSSTIGGMTIVYTDPDGVAVTITATATLQGGTINTSNNGNTTQTAMYGVPLLLNCKASTNITYAFNYASNAASVMQYNLHMKLEAQ